MSKVEQAGQIIDRNRDISHLNSHPQLRRYVECFLETFIVKGLIDPRLRQLAILRIAWRCRQPYEWAQHYSRARQAGVSDEEILAIRSTCPAQDLQAPVQLVVIAADEVVDLGFLTPNTYQRCKALFIEPGLVHEFLHLVAGYRMMATILNTTLPSVEAAGLAFWPPDGVAPEGV